MRCVLATESPAALKRIAWAVLLAPALCLAGCGTLVRDSLVHSYMGIPFDASRASAGIADLARRSLAGDKQAQLNLGIAFEEGRGVEPDLDKAQKLYQLAASDSGGPVMVYVPGVGGGSGLLSRVNVGGDLRGLTEARVRLDQMSKGKLMSTDTPDQMMSGKSAEVDALCRLVTPLLSKSPSIQRQFVPLLIREFQNGDPAISPLQWSRQAIETVFPDIPVSADNRLSYQAFLISSRGGCDVSEQLEDDALFGTHGSDGEGAQAVTGQGEIFDVIPLKRSGNGYSALINFKKGSRTIVDVFALIWE